MFTGIITHFHPLYSWRVFSEILSAVIGKRLIDPENHQLLNEGFSVGERVFEIFSCIKASGSVMNPNTRGEKPLLEAMD